MKGHMMTAQTQPNTAAQRHPSGKIWTAGLITIVISVILNYAVFWVATTLLGIQSDFAPFVNPISIAIFTVILLVVATVVWWWIARRSATPETTFHTVVLVALLLSLIPDALLFFVPGPPEMGTPALPAILVLTAMHVLTWLVTISVLPRASRA